MRVEAGLIVYDSDCSPGVDSPYDVSLDRYVRLDADIDFLGRDAPCGRSPLRRRGG